MLHTQQTLLALLLISSLLCFTHCTPLTRIRPHHSHHSPSPSHSQPIPSHLRGRETHENLDYFNNLAIKDWYSVCVNSDASVGSSSGSHHHSPPHPHDSLLPPSPAFFASSSASSYVIKQGYDDTCVAWGWFSDTINSTGWSYLYLESSESYSDTVQSECAGYLEGYLTANRIYQLSCNLMPALYNNSIPDNYTLAFVQQQVNYNYAQVQRFASTDQYWNQLGLLYTQLQWMLNGYSLANTQSGANQPLSWFVLLSMNLDVDLSDMTTAANLYPPVNSQGVPMGAPNPNHFQSTLFTSHCSALIKMLPDNKELFIAHTTWADYNSMLRTYKLYKFPLSGVKAVTHHFSSYPGFVFSSDDFYQLLETKLTVIETTNELFNPILYVLVIPQTVAIWARTVIANRLAVDGQSWSSIFARENSGTCGNQWMIVDHKQFQNGIVSPGLLWVMEQLPGQHSVWQDMTEMLMTNSYWKSFNRPMFPYVYSSSGYDAYNMTWNTWGNMPGYLFGYEGYFRSRIFDREAPNIDGLAAMQRVMQLNKYQTDPLSQNNSGFAINGRYDLSSYDPAPQSHEFGLGPNGGIDTKITCDSWVQAGTMRVSAISGPAHDDIPPFVWTDQFAYDTHVGLDLVWNFTWVQFDVPNNAKTFHQRQH